MSITRFETNARMSQAVVHGNTVYLAGQIAQKTAGKSVTEQLTEILAAIDKLLAQAGSDKSKLLQAHMYLTDIGNFAEMNKVWESWVVPGQTPARVTIECKLAAPQYNVEVMVVAAK